MKKALSYKILLLLITLALSLALAFSFGGTKSARADDITSPSSAFSGGQSIVFENNNVKATVKSGNTIKINNQLVVDDLAITLDIPADKIEKYSVSFTYRAFFGNEFTEDVVNEFEFNTTGDNVVISAKTENNVLEVNGDKKDGVENKIAGADKCVASISFTFTLKEEVETADIIFKSINQKAGDGTKSYEQTFELSEDKIANFAKPRVSINDLPIIKDAEGKLKVVYGKKYNLSFSAYSVFGNVKDNDLYIDKDSIGDKAASVDGYSDTPKGIAFKNDGETTFTICTKELANVETYTVLKAAKITEDETAPKYIDYTGNENVYNEYQELVTKASEKDYDGNTHSIRLGDSFEIPSLEDLVTDDYNVYSDLSYTVYYRTPSNASGSTSSLKFTVSEAGDYEFYVVFKDSNGNAMEKDDFYTVDEHDESKIVGIDDIAEARADFINAKLTSGEDLLDVYPYFPYVFKFTIQDDAPMSVEVVNDEAVKCYINTEFTATSFKIQSSGYNVTYTLSYNEAANATADAEGWVVIPKSSDVAEDYNDVFTYDEIKTINYDGEYTFTPVKKGTYRIDCEITSDMSERHAEGSTYIYATEEPKVVKVDNHWLRNNIWSVVFLSVGTLSLIGIIVLLCIKPKEETETDETGDALNLNKK